MRKNLIFAAVLLISLSACRKGNSQKAQDNNKNSPESYWTDRLGASKFLVDKDSAGLYQIHTEGKPLKGVWDGKSIKGVTDRNDTFEFEIKGDSATYRIVGVTLLYRRISQASYDSLVKVVGP